MKAKIKLVVIDNHTLGMVREGSNQAEILHTSILKGSSLSPYNPVLLSGRVVRLATKKDFDDFRVCFDGYEKDTVFDYIYDKTKNN